MNPALRRFLLSLFLLFGLLFAFPPHAKAEEPAPAASVRIADAQGIAGQFAEVKVSFDAFEAVGSLSFLVFYDASVLTLSDATLSLPFEDNHAQTNTPSRGVFAFSLVSVDGVSGTGDLVTLTFAIAGETEPKSTPLTLAIEEAYGLSLQPVEIGAVDGSMLIREPVPTVKTAAFLLQTPDSSVFWFGTDVVLEVVSNELNGFAAGTFDILYDPAQLEFLGLELGTDWTPPGTLSALNHIPGVVSLGYATIEGLSAGDPCFSLRFKALKNDNYSSTLVLIPRNLYDADLSAIEGAQSSKTVHLVGKGPALPAFWVESHEGPSTDPFEVDVVFGAGTGIAAGDFVVTYPSWVLCAVSVTDLTPKDLATGYVVLDPDIGNGKIRFSYLNESGLMTEQAVLRLRFEPIDILGSRTVGMNLSGTGVVNTSFQGIPLDYLSGIAHLVPYYTIIYLGYDDSILKQIRVPAQTPLSPPEPPQRLGYTFTGWSSSPEVATEDVVIHATYRDDHATYVESRNVTYDGETQTLAVTNLPEGAEATFSPGTFPKDCGEYPYQITISKDGYEDLVLEATLTILPAPLVVLAEDKESPYGEALVPLTYRIEGETYGETLQVDLSTVAGSAVGRYPIVVLAEHPNFDITLQNGIYQVRALPVDTTALSFPATHFTYDGTEKILEVAGPLPEGVVRIEYANHSRMHAGTSIAVASFLVEAGYEQPSNLLAELTIDPAPITSVVFSDQTFVYDGTAKSIAVNTLLTQYGETLTVLYGGQNSSVNAGTYSVTARLSHPDYLTLELTAVLQIDKRPTGIEADEFTLDARSKQVTLTTEWSTRTVLHSLDGVTFASGLSIAGLSELTDYSLTLYLEETANELASNPIVLSFRTTKDPAVLLALIPSPLLVNPASHAMLELIAGQLDQVHPEEVSAVQTAFDAWVAVYDAWIDVLQEEYETTLPLTRRLLAWYDPPAASPTGFWWERREEEC